jgi:hypothetical protein
MKIALRRQDNTFYSVFEKQDVKVDEEGEGLELVILQRFSAK